MKFLHVLGLVASLALVTSPLTTAGAPAPLSDTYSGIIGIGGDAGDQGSISIKITSTGKYTLRGRAAGIGFSHKGEVPEGGAVSEDFTIKLLGGFIKIQAHLEFVVPVGSDKIEGTAKFTFGEDTATLNFTLYKAFPYTNESPTPFAGRHVIVLTPLDKLSNIPGRGVATVNVSPTGLVKVSGSLADGAKFNCGGRLSETGIFPILNVLYNRTGFIGGFAEFGPASELNVLDWAKVTSKGDPIFRGDLDVNIVPYTPPAAGLPAISFGNQDNSALFALSGGGLV
ncbi:MAG TPA: hypothetical protein VFG14_02300, partial [Chthoniobacteraceae bacterium]|nr:hypothetical protein [Chthoniobacteraceae bacterium]